MDLPWLKRFRHRSATTPGEDKHKGAFFETLALHYLQKQGLSLVQRNHRCRHGEIDLVMRDRDELVFVEVRYRQSGSFGGSAASVTARKQRKLVHAARHFLQQQTAATYCRFDVVAISLATNPVGATSHNIDWIKNAFVEAE